MTKKKVLVTGAAGRIGSVIRRFLGEKYELSSLDIVEVKGIESHVAGLAELDAIRPAFEGKDAVVHLGGDARGEAPFDSVLRNNILGTQNIFEAAREAGVGRVVFASTNHVVGYYPEKEEPYKAVFEGRFAEIRQPVRLLTTDLIRPCCHYGVGKALGEALGSYYHDRYGISCICLRIGGVLMEERWWQERGSGLAMWLSHRDAAQLIERSIDAPPSVGYSIVYGMSNNTLRIHEIESAERILGYRPQDDAGTELDPPKVPLEPYYETDHASGSAEREISGPFE